MNLSRFLLIKGTNVYLNGLINNNFATPGEANLIALLAIITTQCTIGFLYYDSTQQPLLRRLSLKVDY